MRRASRTGVNGKVMPEKISMPSATVAAVCEHDGKFLVVREYVDGHIVFNQPAGHIESGESVLQAVVRETLEETRYPFSPVALLGIYRFQSSVDSTKSYLRFAIRGEVGKCLGGELDQGIIAAEWLDYTTLLECRDQHRSPMVLQCVDDYRSGREYPLDVFSREFT
jgi:8-oxo-dGTP pyrophosphatase MutT (NUDIX family)